MNIDDYINKGFVEVGGIPDREAQASASYLASATKTKVVKKTTQVEDHKLTRKRDILASVAMLDGLKNYVGENISAAQIRSMKKDKLESYFKLYQEKAGQEATNEMMSSLIEMSVKGLSYVANVDNEENLKNELIENKQLRRTLGRQAAEITEKYGDVVAIAKVLFTVGKHLSFKNVEEKVSFSEEKVDPPIENKIN